MAEAWSAFTLTQWDNFSLTEWDTFLLDPVATVSSADFRVSAQSVFVPSQRTDLFDPVQDQRVFVPRAKKNIDG